MTESPHFRHTDVDATPDIAALRLFDFVASYVRAALIACHPDVQAEHDDPQATPPPVTTPTALMIIRLIDSAHELVRLYREADALERQTREDVDF